MQVRRFKPRQGHGTHVILSSVCISLSEQSSISCDDRLPRTVPWIPNDEPPVGITLEILRIHPIQPAKSNTDRVSLPTHPRRSDGKIRLLPLTTIYILTVNLPSPRKPLLPTIHQIPLCCRLIGQPPPERAISYRVDKGGISSHFIPITRNKKGS